MDTQQTIPAVVQGGLIPFCFENIRIKESCWLNGIPNYTMRGIGEWAEYEHPDRAIHKIVERNPHILAFSSLVKLTNELDTGKGTKYQRKNEIRVFNPIGFQLIVNKSNQPKALAFQVAVAHLVVAYMTGNLKPFKWSGDIASALSQIISMPAGSKRKLKVFELAKETGKAWGTIYRMAKKMNGENLKVKGNKPKKTRADAGSFINRPEFQQVKDYVTEHPNAGGKEAKAALGIHASVCSVRRWVRYIRGE